jgi:hypothetical protein
VPKTQSRYQQDLGFTDGRVFLGPGDLVFSGTGVLTRNNPGDWSLNQAASLAVIYAANLTNALIRRTGFGEDLMEQFGGTGIPASAQPQIYRPDVIPSMNTAQQLQPRTALKLKGLKLLSMDVVYLITGAALTLHTIRVDQANQVNNIALAPTVVLANAANGLATATQANPYVTNVPLTAPQQIYRNSVDSALWIEIAATTQAAGAYRLYGVDCLVEYNYN